MHKYVVFLQQILKFEIQLPYTKILVKKKIPYINDIQEFDMKSWLTSFELMLQLAYLSDELKIYVLKELLKNTNKI